MAAAVVAEAMAAVISKKESNVTNRNFAFMIAIQYHIINTRKEAVSDKERKKQWDYFQDNLQT